MHECWHWTKMKMREKKSAKWYTISENCKGETKWTVMFVLWIRISYTISVNNDDFVITIRDEKKIEMEHFFQW